MIALWTTINSAVPSEKYTDGTIIWQAVGDSWLSNVTAYVWIDEKGRALLAEFVPGLGFLPSNSTSQDVLVPIGEPKFDG